MILFIIIHHLTQTSRKTEKIQTLITQAKYSIFNYKRRESLQLSVLEKPRYQDDNKRECSVER